MTPTIHIEFDSDEGDYVLMCESYSRVAPAGPRLFRAPPYPEIQFRHAEIEQAEADASKLRAYLATLTPRKQSKQAIREYSAAHA